MKYFILCICLVGVFGSFLPNKPSFPVPRTQNLIDFIIGNLVAVHVVDSVPSGFPCVNAITNLQNVTQQTLSLIREGDLVKAAELFEPALNDTRNFCGAAANESDATFQNFLDIIKDKTFIFKALNRVRRNFLTIMEDYKKGLIDLYNDNYFNAGVDFGSVVELILTGSDSELADFIVENINNLGSVNWPFTNCAAHSPIVVKSFALATKPAKGAAEGLVAKGSVDSAVNLKQVQIVTLLNGIPLNTQYDKNTKSYQQGDAFDYKFSVTIPGFAPSGKYSISLTFQEQNGSTAGCVHVEFTL